MASVPAIVALAAGGTFLAWYKKVACFAEKAKVGPSAGKSSASKSRGSAAPKPTGPIKIVEDKPFCGKKNHAGRCVFTDPEVPDDCDRSLPELRSPEYSMNEEPVKKEPESGRFYTRTEMVTVWQGVYTKEEAEKYWDDDCTVPDRENPAPAGRDWFSKLWGFQETYYPDVKRFLKVEPSADGKGQILVSKATDKTFAVGTFTTPRLDTLRAKAKDIKLPGKLTVTNELGDVAEKHSHEENRHATFQVASQFNCLEFTHPRATPNDGVTQYSQDRTQGPACSVACGPATVYRNFFARMHTEGRPDQHGQTGDCMIDNLADVSEVLGNTNECMYTVTGGYSLSDKDRMKTLNERLKQLDADGSTDSVRAALRIGIHDDIEVTAKDWGQTLLGQPNQTVTQVFGSALAVGYNKKTTESEDWERFATIVLEASYEATLLAGLLAAERHNGEGGSRRVFLTSLGGGVFGNPMEWIGVAMQRACERYKDYNLDIRVVTYAGEVHDLLKQLEVAFPPQR